MVQLGSNRIFNQNQVGLTIRTRFQSFPRLAEHAKTMFGVEKNSVLCKVP